tara:strand:- start:62 stop:724 length:663 start_codon:yes stop_codon:yes gene_type:complete
MSIEINKQYTREDPSERYLELVEEYKTQHTEDVKPGIPYYNGISLAQHIPTLTNIIKKNNCKTLLDYGCGKGVLYTKNFKDVTEVISKPLNKHWNLDSFKLYDAGYKKHSKYPKGKYDAVICTDVIEHIWKDDLYWFTKELCSFAKKFVFINVACYPAKKTFKDGTNVHVSIYKPQEWGKFFQTIQKEFPSIDFYIVTQHQEMQTNGILLRSKLKETKNA